MVIFIHVTTAGQYSSTRQCSSIKLCYIQITLFEETDIQVIDHTLVTNFLVHVL
jgi:hypothetical protein